MTENDHFVLLELAQHCAGWARVIFFWPILQKNGPESKNVPLTYMCWFCVYDLKFKGAFFVAQHKTRALYHLKFLLLQ